MIPGRIEVVVENFVANVPLFMKVAAPVIELARVLKFASFGREPLVFNLRDEMDKGARDHVFEPKLRTALHQAYRIVVRIHDVASDHPGFQLVMFRFDENHRCRYLRGHVMDGRIVFDDWYLDEPLDTARAGIT